MFKSLEKKVKQEAHRVEKQHIRPVAQELKKISSLPKQSSSNNNTNNTPAPTFFNQLPEALTPSPTVSNDKSEPELFECPLSLEEMNDPVTAPDGRTYERAALQKWYDEGQRTCPVNPSKELCDPKTLPTNYDIKAFIEKNKAPNNKIAM